MRGIVKVLLCGWRVPRASLTCKVTDTAVAIMPDIYIAAVAVRGPAGDPRGRERSTTTSSAHPSCLSLSEPYLYCSYQDQLGAAEGVAAGGGGGGGLNIRASWLAGQDIRGDAALGLCGIMYGTVSADWA